MQTLTLAVVVAAMTLLLSPLSFAGEKMDGSPQTTEAQQPQVETQNAAASQETGSAPTPQVATTDAPVATPPAPATEGTTSTQAAGTEPQATPETPTEEKKE